MGLFRVGLLLAMVGCGSSESEALPEPGLLGLKLTRFQQEHRVAANSRAEIVGRATDQIALQKFRAVSSSIDFATVTMETTCQTAPIVCEYEIHVATLAPGNVDIRIVDEHDKVVDYFRLDVRAAVTLLPAVTADGPRQTRQGRTLVYKDAPMEILPNPKDAAGEYLGHALGDTQIATSDPSIVRIDGPAAATAIAPGSATLSLTIGGVTSSVEIDVVQR
jgi:hypothetical protein